ncbi:MAG TPA: ferrochelatase [Nevskiales bacterium]|nr:ferrochelatase [Nevskiales bacterium]
MSSRVPDTGILLVNLGTPAAPTAGAIRAFLREFLHDRRVVELTRWLWCPILYLFILPFRPRRLVHAYRAIWTAEGSPLLAISRRQAAALEAAVGVPVQLGMRYGQPSIAQGLRALRAAGAARVLVLPLYPQYSATTTASVFDAVADALRRERALPELRFVMDYHDDPGYIAALADSVRRHWAAHGRGDKLLLSFHGIPQQYARAGDPYHGRCHITARLLARALDLKPDDWTLGFQSRVGRAPWLQPYTDHQIEDLAEAGIKTLDVIAPGFSADCLETLEEIRLRYAELFRAKGGGALRYIPALNDDEAHIRALAALARRHLRDGCDAAGGDAGV